MNHTDPFLPLYDALNWSPSGTLPCKQCKDAAWPPSAGCYPSSLEHYESVLGPLPGTRTSARLLLLLQDPRPVETNFVVAKPNKDPRTLRSNEHRYFCLTPVAWKALRLDTSTGSVAPQWPNERTAPAFLRRYLAGAGSWSYDGFLAYFLYLMRPAAALVTDLAKCHFGQQQSAEVFRRCAATHLETEVQLLKPNLVLSFTSRFRDPKIRERVPSLRTSTVLTLFHPAARPKRKARTKRLMEEVAASEAALAHLGYDVPALKARWKSHAEAAW